MDNIYVYLREDLPVSVHEFVTPCLDGYTIYINAKLDDAHQLRAYHHALEHIKNNDFEKEGDVQEIELRAHGIPAEVFVAEKKRRKSPRVRFLEKIGFDFFAAAENEYLDPERR